MSQVASAFAVPSAALADATRWATAGNWERFWEVLRPHEVAGEFAYSGYVIAVLTSYLSESGIELPVAGDAALAPVVQGAQPLLLATGDPRRQVRAALDRVKPTAEELVAYWEEFCGPDEGQDVGAAAMPAGLGWLRSVIQGADASGWCFVTVG